MKIRFLGTRGYIEASTRRHRRHSSIMVGYRRRRLMVDCGEDWTGRLTELTPHAIALTHAHPDHAGALWAGAPCPVWATAASWEAIEDTAVDDRRTLAPRKPEQIEGMTVEAFPVEHSIRAPAVGLRIRAGRRVLFYVPDVVFIHDRGEALDGVDVYVGDGAALSGPLVRRQDDRLIGHTRISTQLTWCAKHGVPRAVITHCGSEIVEGDERTLGAEIRALGRERGIEAAIAHDGLEIVLR